MSERELPEDLAQWPNDPFELIGASASDDERTVRLAYTRLIRRFKPEHYPEHFRKLREAYDTVRARLKWRWESAARDKAKESEEVHDDDRPIVDPSPLRPVERAPRVERPPAPLRPPTPEPQASPEPQSQPQRPPRVERQSEPKTAKSPEPRTEPIQAAPRPRREPTPVVSRAADLEAAWRMAQDGDPRAGYLRLQAMRSRFPMQSDIAIREYWLLKVDPQIDPERHRLEPLSEALGLDRLAGPAAELYRRECEHNPQEAVGERLSALLQNDVAINPAALADLLEWRWRAAGKLRQWREIDADVERFRRSIVNDDERIWARLLLAALDLLAWLPDDGAQNCCKQLRRELDDLRHVHLELSHELDRLDLLIDVAAGWHKIQQIVTIHPEVVTIIQRSWALDVAEYRRECADLVRTLVADPIRGLDMLDEVCRTEPALAVQLESAIDRYCQQISRGIEDDDFDLAVAQHRIAQRIRALPWVTYSALRKRLLAVCLQEGVSPAVLVRMTADIPHCQAIAGGEYLSPHVTADPALRCVYSAWQAFFA